MITTRTLIAIVALSAGCANATPEAVGEATAGIAQERDRYTYCDYCGVNFWSPDCEHLNDSMGTRVVCQTTDGTEWTRVELEYYSAYQRYDPIPGTHLVLRNWCVCNDVFCGATW